MASQTTQELAAPVGAQPVTIYITDTLLNKKTKLIDEEILSLDIKPEGDQRQSYHEVIYNTRKFEQVPNGFEHIFYAPKEDDGDKFYIYYKLIPSQYTSFGGVKKTLKKSSRTKPMRGKRATSKAKRRK